MATGGEVALWGHECGVDLMIRKRKFPEAAVMIVVVYIIASLSMLAFALAFRSRIAIKQSQLLIEMLQQDEIAHAACIQARSILAADDESIDCLDEPWSGWHELVPAEATDHSIDVEDWSWQIYWKLVDESAKINVNLASADILLGLECLDKAAVASILDWIDEDDVPNPDGAEDDYYSRLEPAYNCKDGPMDNIEELLLIKGITPEIYYGSSLDKENRHLTEIDIDSTELADLDSQNDDAGLCEMFTVYSDGRININTTSKQVLDAMPILSDTAVSEIISTQQSVTKRFSSMDDIQNNDNFSIADKLTLMQIAKFNSNHFQLHIKIRKKDSLFWCEYVATIERRGRNTQVLSWQRKYRVMLKDITYFTGDSYESADSQGVN
jgi:type II secretory pathway component PulK